jgi:hypothetical protein
MPPSGKFKSKIVLPPLPYTAQIVRSRNSVLYGIAWSRSHICSIERNRLPAVRIVRSQQENFWLEFITRWHSAESQMKFFVKYTLCDIARSQNSALCSIAWSSDSVLLESAEFFGIARSQNKILSDFSEVIKETVSQGFDLWFFHKSIVPRPLSNTLKYFQILFWICGDICEYVICCIAWSHDSPLRNIALSRLHAIQHRTKFLLKIFSIEIRLDCIVQSLSVILGEKKPWLCNLAWSHDSTLYCIAQSQNCIAQSQLTELWLCATTFKATIKQKFIHR